VSLALVIIQTLAQVLSVLVIIHSLLSFILPFDHPIRLAIGRIIEPMLQPIRRIMRPVGGLDFSPMVLLLLIYVVELLLSQLIVTIF
jgi:YggT family protein